MNQVLPCGTKIVQTKYGDISVKYSMLGKKAMQIKPEYEDCKKAAKKNNVPLIDVIDAAKYQASSD